MPKAGYSRRWVERAKANGRWRTILDRRNANRRAKHALLRASNPAAVKKFNRYQQLNRYGITEIEWNILFEAQGRRCAICKTDDPGRSGHAKNFLTDHDHTTKKVRGILCFRCNMMLGNSRDDPNHLREGATYLESGGVAHVCHKA